MAPNMDRAIRLLKIVVLSLVLYVVCVAITLVVYKNAGLSVFTQKISEQGAPTGLNGPQQGPFRSESQFTTNVGYTNKYKNFVGKDNIWFGMPFQLFSNSAQQKQPNDLNGEQCKKRLPDCIIIGIAKCGTGALIQFLDFHPNVATASKTEDGFKIWEPNFFAANYEKGMDYYLNEWMPCSFSNQITIEKSPQYFHSREAAHRIKAMNSNIKLILIVKDPIVRTVSHFLLQQRLAVTKYVNGKADDPLADFPFHSFEQAMLDSNGKLTGYFVRESFYDTLFSVWLSLFRRDQILVVDGDMMISKPYVELQKVEKFLGLSSYFKEDYFIYNQTRGFYCIKTERIETPKCLKETKGVPHPFVHPKVMKKLKQLFKPHNEMFFKMIGRRFDWGY